MQNDTPLTKLTECQNVVRHCPVYYHEKIQELWLTLNSKLLRKFFQGRFEKKEKKSHNV